MKETLARLSAILESAPPRLLAISEEESARRPQEDGWSPREVLGHLVDSAGNNHQRFVRGQLQEELRFPPYEQEGWVAVQRYREEPWEAIVELWRAYNRHLLHVMSAVPEDRHHHRCIIGTDEPVTLRDLMADYVRHLDHHLGQVFDRAG